MSGSQRPSKAISESSKTPYTSNSNTSKRRRLSPRSDPSTQGETGPSSKRSTPRRVPSLASSAASGSTGADSDGSDAAEEGEEEGEPLHSPSDWTYELVVIQHPQRARACGFGDKDRRPLSPPPIVRLYIRNASGQLVHPNKVSIQFLLLMVDLWSADGNQQRNTVMHPGSTPARQPSPPSIPTSAVPLQDDMGRIASPRPSTADSRPPTSGSRPPTSHYPVSGWGWSDQHSPVASKSTGPSPHTRLAGADQIQDSLPVPSSPTVPLPYPSRPAPFNRSTSYIADPNQTQQSPTTSVRPFTAPSPSRPPRPTSSSGPVEQGISLPSLASLTESLSRPISARLTLNAIRDPQARPSTSSSTSYSAARPSTRSTLTSTGESSRPSWSTESTRPPTDYSFGRGRGSASTWYTSSMSSDERDKPSITGWPPPRPITSGSYQPMISPSAIPPPALMLQEPSNQDDEVSDEEDDTRGGSGSFSRVLVGSVCAMCQRLTDEDGELGLFFFTHDLAVRTEGVFKLKFTLTNLSPLFGGGLLPSQSSPIAAQVYSDPFTVYSAKRFPGVIPTTKLTRVFAAQNIKLPTRQRKGVADVADDGDDEDEEA